MKRMVGRLVFVMIIGAAGAVLFRALRRRAQPSTAASTEWPPFEDRSEAAGTGAAKTGAIGAMATAAEHAHVDHTSVPDWVAPVDGACPTGYPIKANGNSRIFHVPGGRFYERTVAERCYANEQAAERDGYRRAKA